MPRSWIFFDAAETLFTVRGSVGSQYALAARRCGAACDPERLEQAFRICFAAAPPLVFRDRRTGRRRSDTAPLSSDSLHKFEYQWWQNLVRQVCQQAGVALPFSRYFEYLFTAFATSRCWDLYPETLATLKLLKLSGYELGIISNFDSRLDALVEDLGLRPWISHVINSSAAGAAKPDPRIFTEACARTGAIPQWSWHLGDSLTEDVQAAHKAGLNAILLDRDERHSEFSGPKISRLSQIFTLLK